jgi:hypothetical protein
MRIAAVTTTIHTPTVLRLLRKCSPDVDFYVAVDRKTPDISALAEETGAQIILGEEWKCSEACGWNSLSRRNVGFLAALKNGADIIYSFDDDNLPIDTKHFIHLDRLMIEFKSGGVKLQGSPLFNGVMMIGGTGGWFDPGVLLTPHTRHRGFPNSQHQRYLAGTVTDAKIGVAAGLVIGDPDIDATTRMEHHPDIGQVHMLGQSGVVVDPHTWTVFNSQNTAVIRELIPAWFMMPGVGRHDDIYASLIVQRVARERGYHVHFGPPFTYQQRNEHDLLKDLLGEIKGMQNIEPMAALLDAIVLPGKSVIEDTRWIYRVLADCAFVPTWSVMAGLQWLEDVETILD